MDRLSREESRRRRNQAKLPPTLKRTYSSDCHPKTIQHNPIKLGSHFGKGHPPNPCDLGENRAWNVVSRSIYIQKMHDREYLSHAVDPLKNPPCPQKCIQVFKIKTRSEPAVGISCNLAWLMCLNFFLTWFTQNFLHMTPTVTYPNLKSTFWWRFWCIIHVSK